MSLVGTGTRRVAVLLAAVLAAILVALAGMAREASPDGKKILFESDSDKLEFYTM